MHGVAALIAVRGEEEVTEVHLTPSLFEEVRLGQEAHQRRQILRELR
jgi:hypothetical protein